MQSQIAYLRLASAAIAQANLNVVDTLPNPLRLGRVLQSALSPYAIAQFLAIECDLEALGFVHRVHPQP